MGLTKPKLDLKAMAQKDEYLSLQFNYHVHLKESHRRSFRG